jgi:3-hydroxyisobutyrate dehydrogenase
MHQVALLGTGLLGSGFAEGFLTRGGVKLTVWNRTRAKALPLAEKGATVADDPEEAVHGATMVHLILLDDATVDSTIERMRDGLSHDAIIVDHTTNLRPASPRAPSGWSTKGSATCTPRSSCRRPRRVRHRES